jgi:hypothetical protein
MSKKLEILEKALEDMKSTHKFGWDMYGSELCSGNMILQEEELEKKIKKLKDEENKKIPFHVEEDPSRIVDN